MNGVFVNRRNGHKATTVGTRWACNCGAEGEQADDQRANIAAGFHVRHPDRSVPVMH
ncbi:hypothetical protein [Streptomyces sp. NPDC001205]